jgi:hypothetical protein
MNRYAELVSKTVLANIDRLSWKCKGCPRVNQCEDQGQHGESRYCLPLIVAAINEDQEFDTLHRNANNGVTGKSALITSKRRTQ